MRNRKLNGQYTNKLRNIWQQIKDLLLVLFLLNMLINMLGEMKTTSIVIIDSPARASKEESKLETVQGLDLESGGLVKKGEFSAYTASVEETDSDPFTMASGKKVYDGAIANNCLEFGSTVKVNGKFYTVEDRMNKRYGCDHFDIFFAEKSEALKFGRQNIEYEII